MTSSISRQSPWPTRNARASALGLAAAFLLLTSACSGAGGQASEEPPEPAAPEPTAGQEVDILTAAPNAFSMEALGTFVLVYDAQLNCLYTDEPDNNGEPGTGGRVVIEWPAGYSARVSNGVVSVFDDLGARVAKTGAPFQMSGGGGPYNGSYCDAIGIWHASSAPHPPR